MKKTLRNIILVLAAALVLGGCDMGDSGGLKMVPPEGEEREFSPDAALKSLSVENFSISPAFDAATLEYTLVASSATTSLSVKAIGPDGASVAVGINGDPAVPVIGPDYRVNVTLESIIEVNDITASVTSEDGQATNVYHIRVYYLGSSASLSGLGVSLTNGSPGAVSSALSPSFDPMHLTYAVGISYATTSIDFTVSMPEGSGMTASVDGWTALSGVAVPITNLPAAGGSRDITITVTSQDESVTKNYTITVTRGTAPSTENRLNFLDRAVKVWGVWNDIDDFGPAASASNLAITWVYDSSDGAWLFSSISDYRVYTRPIDPAIQGITVNGSPCEVIQVDDIDTYRCIVSTDPYSGYNIALPIVVTAESGDERTYTLTITN